LSRFVLASRRAWRATAQRASAQIAEIELVCSDPTLHRRRVETRSPDIDGHILPAWDEIANRTYEAWDRDHLILDTAEGSIDSLIERVLQHIANALRL
jgi:hypothetical protein